MSSTGEATSAPTAYISPHSRPPIMVLEFTTLLVGEHQKHPHGLVGTGLIWILLRESLVVFHWFLRETAQGVLRLRQCQLLGYPGIRRQRTPVSIISMISIKLGSFLLRSSSLSMAATIPNGMHGVGLKSGSGD